MANKDLREKIKKQSIAFLAAASMTCAGIAPVTAYATEGTTQESTDTPAPADSSAENGAAPEEVEVTQAEKREAVKEAIVEKTQEEIKGHKRIAENDKLELYLKEENLSLIVRDKETGAIMESTVSEPDDSLNTTWTTFIQSGIGFQILNGLNEERSDLLAAQSEISVTKNDNGFTADVTLTKYEISFKINVELTEDGLSVEIPNESIVEAKEKVTIGSIYVYPFMGYTYASEREGYIFMPDGNGALVYLEDNDGRFSSPMTLKVWGDNAGVEESYVLSLFWDEYQTINDAEFALAPVFGMVHTDTEIAMLGIIEEGAVDAKIIAYPNGAVTNYNWVTPQFTMRRIYKQLTNKEGTSSVQLQEEKRTQYDIKIKYLFSVGEEADYAGMANAYRSYLINQGIEPVEDQSFRIRLDFLGTDKENGMISKKTVTMTTVEDIEEIYKDLKAEGITEILSVYKGWQEDGVWSNPITKYKADSAIGGNRKLSQLLKDTKEQGILFYLYHDALRANPSTVNTVFNVIKKLDESVYKENTYKEIYEYFNYQTPDKAKERLESALKSYDKAGVENLALAGISDHLFSYNYSGKQYSREDTYLMMEAMIKESAENRSLSLENPFSCYWEYTDNILNMPVNSSNYIFTDEEVPFLSIALKGLLPMYADYTNFEADQSQYFLELAETGIYPSFYLTKEDPVKLLYTNSCDLYTSEYEVYKPEIIHYYQELKALNDQVEGAYITDRERFADHVVEVTYSNGVKVYVNYSEKNVTHEGVSLDAMSYKVGESE